MRKLVSRFRGPNARARINRVQNFEPEKERGDLYAGSGAWHGECSINFQIVGPEVRGGVLGKGAPVSAKEESCHVAHQPISHLFFLRLKKIINSLHCPSHRPHQTLNGEGGGGGEEKGGMRSRRRRRRRERKKEREGG